MNYGRPMTQQPTFLPPPAEFGGPCCLDCALKGTRCGACPQNASQGQGPCAGGVCGVRGTSGGGGSYAAPMVSGADMSAAYGAQGGAQLQQVGPETSHRLSPGTTPLMPSAGAPSYELRARVFRKEGGGSDGSAAWYAAGKVHGPAGEAMFYTKVDEALLAKVYGVSRGIAAHLSPKEALRRLMTMAEAACAQHEQTHALKQNPGGPPPMSSAMTASGGLPSIQVGRGGGGGGGHGGGGGGRGFGGFGGRGFGRGFGFGGGGWGWGYPWGWEWGSPWYYPWWGAGYWGAPWYGWPVY